MTEIILIDSNVIIDVSARASSHGKWSWGTLRRLRADSAPMIVNQIILSETTNDFADAESQLAFLNAFEIGRRSLPFESCYAAGKAHWIYRHSGGKRTRTLPDFLIGAHAIVENLILMTRDERIYRAYFPTINIICPETHPL